LTLSPLLTAGAVRVRLHPLGSLLSLVLVLAPLAAGQQPTPAGVEVITNAQVFWALSNDEKMKLHHVRFDILVYYYDPVWQLMWGVCDGQGSFLPVRGERLPLETGQLVRIEGNVQPARGIFRNEVTVTVLKDRALPQPQPLAGRIADAASFDSQWTVLEGYVSRQSEVDGSHMLYEVLSEGWLVTVRVLVKPDDRVPQLVDSRVRINGVYVADRDVDQKIRKINLWVPRMADVTVVGELAQDERFQRPRTPLDRLAASEQEAWVRVEGEVQEYQAGRSLTIRDESAVLAMATPQPASLKPGDRVEVVGRVHGTGLTATLAEAHFRPLAHRSDEQAAKVEGASPRYNLRRVDQIFDLPVGEVARGYHVTLKGVVSWADPRAAFFYVQDSAGGICVWRGSIARTPAIGDAVEVKGTTTLGRFSPEIRLQEMTPIGVMAMPAPRSVTLQQALTGAEEGRWVELRGYLRQAVNDGDWTRLDLTTVSGEFSAYAPPEGSYAAMVGATVQVSGVCAAEANSRRQMTGLRLWVPGVEAVKVIEPAPANPFDAPHQTLTSLKQFSGAATFNHRVSIAGVVLAQVPGRYLILQEGESGLMVYTRETQAFTLGDTVEAAGLPGQDGSRLVLREARIKPGAMKLEVVPLRLEDPAALPTEADACLVRVRAYLKQVSRQNDHWRLTLQARGAMFDALLYQGAEWSAPPPDSELELTGVHLLEFDETHRPRAFRLLLRNPGDLQVVRQPPWWTTDRALTMAAGLAFCSTLGIVWVVLLRRRVRKQTEQIRQQLEKEARLQSELERSSRLESLGVLAGGIAHDFNNLLTAILGNLGLAAMDKRVMAAAGDCISEAEKGARRARDITQQLLTFAKGGDPVRTAVLLPDVVSEAAGFARHGSNVRFDFDYPPDLPPGNVDAGQISRVVHNLVINAVQAMPDGGVVSIALAAVNLASNEIDTLSAGSYLRLTIADTGKGIAPENLPRIFDPYFSTKSKAGNSGLGLATVRSIVKKHSGHIEVESQVNRGTTFRIWLPAAKQEATAATDPVTRNQKSGSARILVMDDEDVIRRVAGRMLSLANHQAVFAADGSEAVHAYAAAQRSGQPFDMVIFDLTVPGGMGGKDALQELRKLDPGVRAIASSGYSNDPIMANPHAYGFRCSLPKPYDIPDLMQAVDEARR
jgi:two-component system cell cycle sensor histidine kinase/response regulator CckA